MAAARTFSPGVVFKKLDFGPTSGTDDLKNIPGFPKGRILARAHGDGHILSLP
jgi:hypothetical protein